MLRFATRKYTKDWAEIKARSKGGSSGDQSKSTQPFTYAEILTKLNAEFPNDTATNFRIATLYRENYDWLTYISLRKGFSGEDNPHELAFNFLQKNIPLNESIKNVLDALSEDDKKSILNNVASVFEKLAQDPILNDKSFDDMTFSEKIDFLRTSQVLSQGSSELNNLGSTISKLHHSLLKKIQKNINDLNQELDMLDTNIKRWKF